jgi:Tol biopolymer transport system component
MIRIGNLPKDASKQPVRVCLVTIFILAMTICLTSWATHLGVWLSPGRAEGIDGQIAYLPYIAHYPGADYRIVFVSSPFDPDISDPEIYIVSANGNNLTRLTDNKASEEAPDWSPDGTKIVFASDRDGNLEIYSMDVDGSNVMRITRNETPDTDPNWSPDGSQIAYTCTSETGIPAVCTIHPDGTGFTQLTPGGQKQRHPIWLNCSTRIAFIGEDADLHHHIYIRQLEASEPTQISDMTATKFTLSCDSQTIVFLDGDEAGYNPHYHIMDIDGSHLNTVLTSIPIEDIDIAPDRTRFVAVTSLGDDRELVVFMAMDNDFKFLQLVDNESDDLHPRWSPVKIP